MRLVDSQTDLQEESIMKDSISFRKEILEGIYNLYQESNLKQAKSCVLINLKHHY